VYQTSARKTGHLERRGQRGLLLAIGTGKGPGGKNVLIQFEDGTQLVTVPGALRK